MYAISPVGTRIVGTAETVSATAELVKDSFHRNDDGSIWYDHSGDSEVFWDSMTTNMEEGQIVFVDENGDEWLENQITLVVEEDDYYV